MNERKGEKIGWIGGWMGGFIWLLVLSLIWLFHGQTGSGLIGLCLFAAGVMCIFVCTPWKHPRTSYGQLMLPIYLVFFGSIGFAGAATGFKNLGLTWWSILWVFPLLIPLVTAGRRRWDKP